MATTCLGSLIPKVCIVRIPRHGGNIAVHYFTPQTGHASMAVSGGCCLAAACLIPGTIGNKVAQGIIPPSVCFSDFEVSIENPAGRLDATVVAKLEGCKVEISSAAYRRSAQILMRGSVPLYRASAELIGAMGG
jgi:2-methylaconitate cis-trans-isomerase PrpF